MEGHFSSVIPVCSILLTDSLVYSFAISFSLVHLHRARPFKNWSQASGRLIYLSNEVQSFPSLILSWTNEPFLCINFKWEEKKIFQRNRRNENNNSFIFITGQFYRQERKLFFFLYCSLFIHSFFLVYSFAFTNKSITIIFMKQKWKENFKFHALSLLLKYSFMLNFATLIYCACIFYHSRWLKAVLNFRKGFHF